MTSGDRSEEPKPDHGSRGSFVDDFATSEQTIRSDLLDEVSGIGDALDEFWQNFPFLSHSMLSGGRPALSTVANHILNDFMDLLRHATAGDGRAAVRTCRSLFECVVVFHDLVADPSLDERYEAHRVVSREALAAIDHGHERLDGGRRKSANHALRKVQRDLRVPLAEALDLYGPGFRRGWTPITLRDRATAHGLEGEYDFYRFSSALVHGAAGGVAGVRAEIEEGRFIHRTGPAIRLCPMALLHGLRYFDLVLKLWGDEPHGEVPPGTVAAIGTLLDLWPAFWEWANAVDASTWPTGEPVNTVSVLVLPRLLGSYWIACTHTGLAARATPPTLDEADSARLDGVVAQIKRRHHLGPREISIAVSFAQCFPAANATWQPWEYWLGGPPLYIADREKVLEWRSPVQEIRRGGA